MPTYSFEARNNYGDIETFAPYDSKREGLAGQDRLAEKGYTDFSAVTEQEETIEEYGKGGEFFRITQRGQEREIEVSSVPFDLGDDGQDRQNYTDTQDRESYLPEIPITDEQEPDEEPESVDIIAQGYEWVCPNCDITVNVIEYTERVTCPLCHRTYTANSPEHAYG